MLIKKKNRRSFFFLFRFMAINLYLLLVNFDLYSVLNSDDRHFYEPSTYKYSKQGNIIQFINMRDFRLFNNNIFLSIISINLIPIIIIFFLIPITILRRYQFLLTIFLCFTSSGLMADVFLRVIPHILVSDNNPIETQNQFHVHHQHENHAGLFILVGIFFSFIIEKIFRYSQSMFYIEQFSYRNFSPLF